MNPVSKPGQPSQGPQLRRSDSLPARMPSDPIQRPEIENTRPSVTRPGPDVGSPINFGTPGQTAKSKEALKEQAKEKVAHLRKTAFDKYDHFEAKINSDPEFREIKDRAEARARAVNAGKTEQDPKKLEQNIKNAVIEDLMSHPRFRVELGNARWEKQGIPNAPTSTRPMTEKEQVFLMNAHNRISEDVRKNPFHAFGEIGVLGDKTGKITEFNYQPRKAGSFKNMSENKYNLHTHPPFAEPFTSSASGQDHILAARFFDKNDMFSYVSNGKEVVLINPNNMGLQRLVPNPEVEKKLGKFPVAFEMPEPKTPPYPFNNHEV
ncbi:MAG TPA: hypothetical protein VK465_05780 [Fibrobacteria bacterium]|nr:hypothetical protein [Fibrobacteria bacterium]